MAPSKNDAASTEVAVSENMARGAVDVMGAVQAMASGAVQVFSTVQGDDFDAKKRTLAAITDSEPLADHLREKIDLVDFVVQVVQMADDNGEVSDQPRVILIDKTGKAYHAISSGILRSLQNYTGLLGMPNAWPEGGVAVMADEQRGRSGFRFMTLKLA